ncbi:hypothetical protein GcM1_245082 [Golovinomyces cichoracearum]|uniref:Telomeric single stranded DNA binding POT1/Cdc13 domain-containing protein n=1 Tax=Golovinomyces cichoracearum TaxID=62708 RepID=A0A420IFA3_9PEZI|nr:hypothetical protein GcM1_245082 [Golovinomyces cichoracearum]
MAKIVSECSVFGNTNLIPIAQLSPALASITSQSIEAVVTLTWPFNSASSSITFLLSEPDFRLRKEKGQVRVQFSGSCGKIITKERVSSGDRLVVGLEGVEWIKDDLSMTVPGNSIEYKLRFSERLLLQFQREGQNEIKKICVDHPSREDFASSSDILNSEPEYTLRSAESSKILDNPLLAQNIIEDDLYSSPAFLKRARMSYGSLFDSALDDFSGADGTEQGFGRKRTRLSSNRGYDYRSFSSEEDREDNIAEISTRLKESTKSSIPPAMKDEAVQTYSENCEERLESIETTQLLKSECSDSSKFISNEKSSEGRLVPEDEFTLTSNKNLAPIIHDLVPKPPEHKHLVSREIPQPSLISQFLTHKDAEQMHRKPILKIIGPKTSSINPDIDTHTDGEEINESDHKSNEDNKLDLKRISSRSKIESISQARGMNDKETRTDRINFIISDNVQTRGSESRISEAKVPTSKQLDNEETAVELTENGLRVSTKLKSSEEPESDRSIPLSNSKFIATDLSDRDKSPTHDLSDQSSISGNETGIHSNIKVLSSDSHISTVSSNTSLIEKTNRVKGVITRSKLQESSRVLDDSQSINKSITKIREFSTDITRVCEDYSCEKEAGTDDIEEQEKNSGEEENSSQEYSDLITPSFAYTDYNEYEDELFYVGQDSSSPAGYENSREDYERNSFSEEEKEIFCYISEEESPTIINLLSSDDEEEPNAEPMSPSLISDHEDSINGTEDEREDEISLEEKQDNALGEKDLISDSKRTELLVNPHRNDRDIITLIEIECPEKKQKQPTLQILGSEEEKNEKLNKNSIFLKSTEDETIAVDADFANKEISRVDKITKSQKDNPRLLHLEEGVKSKDSLDIENKLISGANPEASSKLPHEGLICDKNSLDIEEVPYFLSHQQNDYVGLSPESSLPKPGKLDNDTQCDTESVKPRTPSKTDLPTTGTINSRLRGHEASIELALSSMSSPSKKQSPSVIDMKLNIARTLRTELSEYTSLKLLRYHLNKKLDVFAIITSSPAPPKRVKGGPKDYLLSFNITDPTIAPGNTTRVQIFRPCQEALPLVDFGDGILLRNFQVLIEKRLFFLRSKTGEGSSWAVFKGAGEIQIRGPPVELSAVEVEYVSDLKNWFSELDTVAHEKISRANQKSTASTK